MTNKTDIIDQIWTAFFIVTPVVILTRLSENFGDSSTNRMLFAGLFGGLGGLLGWGLYYFVKRKTTITKTIALTAIIGLCISTIFITSYLTKSKLTTCEICGYKTLKSTDTECAYCGNKTWDIVKSQKLTRFSEKKYWIIDEQISWFSIDSLTEKIDFYSPTIDEGFAKDKNWRPLVTEQEIKDELNYQK
jgi:ribosomal protein L37E